VRARVAPMDSPAKMRSFRSRFSTNSHRNDGNLTKAVFSYVGRPWTGLATIMRAAHPAMCQMRFAEANVARLSEADCRAQVTGLLLLMWWYLNDVRP
jgi:hypothetical protein